MNRESTQTQSRPRSKSGTNSQLGEHYGYSREWILLLISVMNCISAEENIPFEELVNHQDIREEIVRRTRSIVSDPSRKYNTNVNDIITLMDQIKMCPNFLIPRSS